MSDSPRKVSLEAQQQQIKRILDLDPYIQPQNATQTTVVVLNTESLELPSGMTKEQYFELNSLDVRRRNWSGSSLDSADGPVKPLYGDKEIIYHDLEDTDTLQKLALKFNCKISEIKHANKIYTDAELHALRTIKIPVVRDGFIHDEYLKQQTNSKEPEPSKTEPSDGFYGNRKDRLRIQINHEINPDLDFLPSSDDEDYDIFNRTNENKPLLPVEERKIVIGQPIDQHSPTLSDFIEKVDVRIQREIQGVKSQKEDMNKVVDALLSPVIFPSDNKKKEEKFGTACYMSWKFYLVVLCVVAIIVPLLYFFHFHKS